MNRNPDGTLLTTAQLAEMVPGFNLGNAAGHGENMVRGALLQGTMLLRYGAWTRRELELRTEVRNAPDRVPLVVSASFLAAVTHAPGNGRFGRGKEAYNGRNGQPHRD